MAQDFGLLAGHLCQSNSLQIFDNKSLFELTYTRNSKFCDKTLIVSNQDQYFLALESDRRLQSTISIRISIQKHSSRYHSSSTLAPKDEIVLVTPSDHLIKDEKAYENVIQKTLEFAKNDYIVTFGIKPNCAEQDMDILSLKIMMF